VQIGDARVGQQIRRAPLQIGLRHHRAGTVYDR
jgi:hypothetical protein